MPATLCAVATSTRELPVDETICVGVGFLQRSDDITAKNAGHLVRRCRLHRQLPIAAITGSCWSKMEMLQQCSRFRNVLHCIETLRATWATIVAHTWHSIRHTRKY